MATVKLKKWKNTSRVLMELEYMSWYISSIYIKIMNYVKHAI